MLTLDIRTVIFSYVITDIVSTLVMVLLWLQNRNRFGGLTLWVFNFIFQTFALILIISRGHIPDFLSMVVSNTMVITGALLGLLALQRYVGIKGKHIHNYFLIIIFVFVQTWFTIIKPDLAVRNLNISVAMLIICFQCAWLLIYSVPSGIRKMTIGTGIIFSLYCLVAASRITGFFLVRHTSNDYFTSGIFETLVMISFQILFILLTFSLTLMFNKRLLGEIASSGGKILKSFPFFTLCYSYNTSDRRKDI